MNYLIAFQKINIYLDFFLFIYLFMNDVSENSQEPIDSITESSGISIIFNSLQFSNAYGLMYLMKLGIVTCLIFQLANIK